MKEQEYAALECQIQGVCRQFFQNGEYVRFEQLCGGHINDTYRVYLREEGEVRELVLQKVNTYVFKNPVAVMQNIAAVTEYLQTQGDMRARTALRYFATRGGAYFVRTPDNGFWRCCSYIANSVSYERSEDLELIEESGKAFGTFGRRLTAYPVQSLRIVIPHFHNTVRRFEDLRQAENADEFGRRAEVVRELMEYYQLQPLATTPYRLQCAGVLPLRVTHNDTKLSNVLFEKETKNYLSVIDLDTVMPGLLCFDFGDAIRAGASTAGEDEQDLSKVTLDFAKFEAFTRGYVRALDGAAQRAELQSLALGALAMTVECGARFLTDYLNGDRYFKVDSPKQNLYRARCQLRLAKDMQSKLQAMQSVVDRYADLRE